MGKTKTTGDIEMMTIAFPYGGILPSEVTGGDEQTVSAHKTVEVPRVYGLQLVGDRFAYVPDEGVNHDTPKLSANERKALEKQLDGLRADLAKADKDEQKTKLTAEISEIELKLAA
jgi:hypothetical protein